jgi:hypothetical protein
MSIHDATLMLAEIWRRFYGFADSDVTFEKGKRAPNYFRLEIQRDMLPNLLICAQKCLSLFMSQSFHRRFILEFLIFIQYRQFYWYCF